jgi:hypothetical protein
MDFDKTIAEMTLDDVQGWLDDNFEFYVIAAKYHDPEAKGELYFSNGKGGLYERVGLVELLKDNVTNERDMASMANMEFFGDEDEEDS